MLNYCLATNTNVDVLKESCNFMYSLLESRSHYDETFCNIIAKRIMQPLMVVCQIICCNATLFLLKLFADECFKKQ